MPLFFHFLFRPPRILRITRKSAYCILNAMSAETNSQRALQAIGKFIEEASRQSEQVLRDLALRPAPRRLLSTGDFYRRLNAPRGHTSNCSKSDSSTRDSALRPKHVPSQYVLRDIRTYYCGSAGDEQRNVEEQGSVKVSMSGKDHSTGQRVGLSRKLTVSLPRTRAQRPLVQRQESERSLCLDETQNDPPSHYGVVSAKETSEMNRRRRPKHQSKKDVQIKCSPAQNVPQTFVSMTNPDVPALHINQDNGVNLRIKVRVHENHCAKVSNLKPGTARFNVLPPDCIRSAI